jgi:phosphopantetheinyl transferase (holo-ACP synthase)
LAARYAAKLAVLDLLGLERTHANALAVLLAETDTGPRVVEVQVVAGTGNVGERADTTTATALVDPRSILISISHDSGLAVGLAALDSGPDR